MIQIDGSFGEGGGQVLRTSLTLSLFTGQPFEIYNIRARRKRPGLQPQHLKCVEAVALISNGQVTGGKIGSMHLVFEPGQVIPGDYRINIGTAGATSLVLHTIYLPLAMAEGESNLTITGGTHVPWSPCYHFLSIHWLHYLKQIGFNIKLKMDRAGFYPKGDGKIRVEISPIDHLKPVTLLNRGELIKISGISAIANLDYSIAERQRNQSLKRLERMGYEPQIAIEKMPSRYKNTMLLLQSKFETGSGCFTALGAIGKRAEKVADEAVDDLFEYLNSNGCIDKYLTDQLILPLSIIPGESTFSTAKVTNHLITNAEVVKKFLNIKINIEGEIGNRGIVKIVNGESK
ncbi:MAG: RNA 3'-phosphate cyclase [bacterium]|nr:MAG: RNA 3'-phosphate cyclase [bacterium]